MEGWLSKEDFENSINFTEKLKKKTHPLQSDKNEGVTTK